MSVLTAIGQLYALIGKVPPEIRALIVDLVRDLVGGKGHEDVAEKAMRASIRLAAMRGIRP